MTGARRRLPFLVILAALAPSAILALDEVSRELGGPVLPVSGGTLFAFWLFTTVPLVLLVVGLRRMGTGGDVPLPDLQAALDAVARAERVAQLAFKTLSHAEEVLAQRAPETPGAAPRSRVNARVLLVGVLALVVAGAAVGLVLLNLPEPPEFVHHHAAFAVFVDGERVEYTDPAFDLSQRSFLRGHLHVPDQDVIHIEGAPGLTLGEFFARSLLADLTSTSLTLDTVVHGGETYRESGNLTLRLFVAHDASDAWTEVTDVPGYVPMDQDRVLVTFGDASGDGLALQEEAVSREIPAGA